MTGEAAGGARQDLVRIFTAAMRAVEPGRLVQDHLVSSTQGWAVCDRGREVARGWGSMLVVGAGKAAARMAAGCEASLGRDQVRGLVIVPDGFEVPLSSVRLARASHPMPDARGAEATAEFCRLIASARRRPILCLISGGASSLLVRPRLPVTLPEKIETSRLLLRSGAPIGEVNTVRKHLSEVKGGGLLRLAAARPVVSLILSDVIGDDPCVIGSGPTTPDPTSYADAQAVLRRVGKRAAVPVAVRALVARGVRGEVPETVKPDDPEVSASEVVVIGSNQTALRGAAREAARLGYTPLLPDTPLAGDTTRSALQWVESVKREVARRPSERCCVIAGGETTVEVKGGGRGGRNSEFALALAESLSGEPITVLSAGTDGIDGPTDAAGAFVGADTVARARWRGLDPDAALRDNDSYGFFDALGDLFRCGPTGTNVMDIKLAVSPTPTPDNTIGRG